MRAYINPIGGVHTDAPLKIRVDVIDSFGSKGALKARKYTFRADTSIDGWKAPEPRLLGNKNTPSRYRLADPCWPAWSREVEPREAMAEVDWLESIGAAILGDCGQALHRWRAKQISDAADKAEVDSIVAAAIATPWTEQDEIWMRAILVQNLSIYVP